MEFVFRGINNYYTYSFENFFQAIQNMQSDFNWKEYIGYLFLLSQNFHYIFVKMKFSEMFDKAYDTRDRDVLSDLLDTNFVLIRHSTAEEVSSEKMLDMWVTKSERVEIRNQRVIYENNEILVLHSFLYWPSGSKEAVLSVRILKNDKAIRMEIGATPLPS